MFGIFSSGNGIKGRDMPGWCIGSVKGKLIPGVFIGGQCIPRGFWDEAPACFIVGVLKVTSTGELMRGSIVLDGLIGGWIGAIDAPDELI